MWPSAHKGAEGIQLDIKKRRFPQESFPDRKNIVNVSLFFTLNFSKQMNEKILQADCFTSNIHLIFKFSLLMCVCFGGVITSLIHLNQPLSSKSRNLLPKQTYSGVCSTHSVPVWRARNPLKCLEIEGKPWLHILYNMYYTWLLNRDVRIGVQFFLFKQLRGTIGKKLIRLFHLLNLENSRFF